jgi:hypothetical protein
MAKPPRQPESFRTESRLESLRTPPQNVEAEQNVLGSLLLNPDCLGKVGVILQEADFWRRDHRLIYRAIRELAEKRKPFDPVTLGEWFEASQIAEQIGGSGYLIQLASDTHSAANVGAYAEIVRDHSLKRQAIEAGTELVNAGFEAGRRDASELLASAQTSLARLVHSASNAERMRPTDLRALSGEQAKPPRFVMAPYFPRGVVTLFGGHGGAGKSTVALTHAAHVASGKWWAGHQVEAGKVAMFSLEDEARVIGFRLQRIIEQYGLDADRVFANLQVFDWSDGDTALVAEKSEFGIHTLEPTQLFARLKVAAAGADLVIIDNASDAFDANENSKRQVRGFFHLLKTGIAQPNDSAVMLLAHIDKNAARFGAAGNSYSGSTAWHNSARSRLALVESKDDGLELRQEKANFGKKAEPVALRTADFGVLVPMVAGQGGGTTNEGQDAAGVLAALRAAAAGGTPVGNGRMGPGNAHQTLATFAALPARLKSAKGKDAFWAALDSLVATGRVLVEERWVGGKNKRRFLVEAGTSPTLFHHPPHPPTGEPKEPTVVGPGFPELGEGNRTQGTQGTNGNRAIPEGIDP